ncbi:hypothetical protein CEQ21_03000 [Niallia circulans]|uniref:Uncharacterized protein n=1 Tax=Niallia circulans TaxID=1397 RepID=A0A553SSH0_NIACI|nr:hypothetical protein [Niallia circulans]TRZ39926.1 hypothetical protein CEQ21_03000 [Niallia circulans]
MVYVIPWNFNSIMQSTTDIAVPILDEQANEIGKMELTFGLFSRKKEEGNLFSKKEVLVRQNCISLQDNNKENCVNITCHTRPRTIGNQVLKRKVEYIHNEESHIFNIDYLNETAKYFYQFVFEDDTYQVFFDDDGTTFKIQKNKAFVAKFEQGSNNIQNYEIEAQYENHAWLWLALFVHLYYNFPRNNGIIFRS